jgi:hypothetical protein
MNAALQSRTSTQSTLSPVRRLLAPCLAALAISGCIIEVPPEDESSTGGDGGSSSSSADASSTSGNGTTGSGSSGSFDPYSLWRVTVVEGTIPDNDQGSAWDADGSAPDPYVGVQFGSSDAATSFSTTAQDTYGPIWGETVISGVAAIDLQTYFSLGVWDEDLTDDDVVGWCAWPIYESDFGTAIPLSCPADGVSAGYTVWVYLEPV